MKNAKLIYDQTVKLLKSQPEMPYDEHLGFPFTNDRYHEACQDYYLKAMLLIKEFDGVSGPLYLHLKKFNDFPSNYMNDINKTLNHLLNHLKMFYSESLIE